MHMPISILIVFFACPIAALLFVVRLVCALFSSKVANKMRKHPIYHGIWGCVALVGVLALIRGIAASSHSGETRDTLSSWYVLPPVQLRPPLRADHGDFFCVATEAPIAVSAGGHFLQVWKLGSLFQGATAPLNLFDGSPSLFEYEHPIVISPDGKIIAVATEYGTYCVDWKSEKVLWETDALEHEGYYGKHLAIGDNGRTLFAAGAHTIERWDLLSGQHHAVLIANETNIDGIVRFLKTSRSGKVLIAGFGLNYNQRPQSFAVWEVGKDEPALKFEEKEGASADLSPDGEWIALSRFGTKKVVLFKWRKGERKEVSLQNSRSNYSVLWSPDGKRLAVYSDSTYPASILIYDAATWKPIAHWDCGKIGQGSEFTFGSDGTLYQIRNNELNALDVPRL